MKHPFYLAWIVVTMGMLGMANLRGWYLLPGAPTGSRPSSSGSSSSGSSFWFFPSSSSGGRSSFGGSFHK